MPFLPAALRRRFARSEMRARSNALLEAREYCLRYAGRARGGAGAQSAKPRVIWQYWDQGERFAPPIIAACLASVRRHCQDFEIRVLDAGNLSRYVNLNETVGAREVTRTHLSDLIRLELLATHGGAWLDASVFLTGPLPEAVQSAEFFCYTRDCDPFLMSSWLLSAQPGHPLVTAWREALYAYWRENRTLIDYFLIHHMFEALITLDSEFRKTWEAAPYLSSYVAHTLQNVLSEPFSAERFAEIRAATPVHKLTYKIAPAPQAGAFFEAIVARRPETQ